MNNDINIKLWYEKFSYIIDIKFRILLVLAALHYHKHISDAKLKGQFSSLRKGDLQKFKRTYHCDITDRWYNEDKIDEVFSDCILFKGLKTIPFKEFIKYISLFENKGYNHAINVFGTEYIYPIFNQWNPEYNDSFEKFAEFSIPNVSSSENCYTCYECGHSHSEYSKNCDENIKIIDNWLHNMKKGDLKKIPFNTIKKYSWF